MAMKRRRNAGAPKRRAASTKMRNAAPYKQGQRVAAKLIAGRRLSGSQKEIRTQIHALIRQHGSKKDIDLLEGPIGAGKPPHSFRKGVASVAADVAGFKPSRSSSKAGKTVTNEYKRDKKDTKKAYKGKYDSAMEMKHGENISLGDAWKVMKGEMTLTQAKKGVKANPRKRKNGTKKGMARKTARRAYSKKRNPVNFYDLY